MDQDHGPLRPGQGASSPTTSARNLRKFWGLAETAATPASSADVKKVLQALDKKLLDFAKLAMADKAKVAEAGTGDAAAGSERGASWRR